MSFGSSAASTSTSTTGGSTSTATSSGPAGGLITSVAPTLVGSATNMYYVSRHFDVSAVLQALQQTDGARLLANPTLRLLDRKVSEIRIVSEIPVQQLTQTEMGGNIGTTTFREAGITLSVEPEIADDTWVQLSVAPEFSALRGFQNGQPIIDRRQATTKVLMMTGDTLVLGGLRRRNEIETVAGVPGLMNIKYLGNLFRSHRTTVTESELIIFIQAEILGDGCMMDDRQQMAFQVATATLDEFPPASIAPFIPNCNDPYCPYHNPPPRPQEEWFRAHPQCIHAPDYCEPENPQEPTPTQENVDSETIPAPEPPAAEVPEVESPEAKEPVSDYNLDELNENKSDSPPPVVVDPTAARRSNYLRDQRLVTKRLPRVDQPQPSVAARPQVASHAAPLVAKRPSTELRKRLVTDPKARIAQSPSVRRTTSKTKSDSKPSEPKKSEPKKSSWLGEILR